MTEWYVFFAQQQQRPSRLANQKESNNRSFKVFSHLQDEQRPASTPTQTTQQWPKQAAIEASKKRWMRKLLPPPQRLLALSFRP
jgi:hypothetical protein